MGWMDVLIIVILMVSSFRGLARGLIMTLFGMLSFIVAGFCAKLYYPVVSAYILGNDALFVGIQRMIKERIKGAAAAEASTLAGPAQTSIFEILKFPKTMETFLMRNESIRQYSAKAMEGIYGYLADALTRMFVDFISILIIFVLVKLLLQWLAHILNGISHLPLLHQFNQMGGLVFGGIQGLFIILIFITLITPLVSMGQYNIFAEGLEASVIGKFLYNNNPILYLFRHTEKYLNV